MTGWRVLVVDDDPGMRETLGEILRRDDIPCATAPSGRAAEEIVKEGGIALAIVDQRLPDVLGIELVDRLTAYDEDLPILLLSGYASAEDAVAAVGKVEDYLVKPVRPEQVVTARAVSRIAASRSA